MHLAGCSSDSAAIDEFNYDMDILEFADQEPIFFDAVILGDSLQDFTDDTISDQGTEGHQDTAIAMDTAGSDTGVYFDTSNDAGMPEDVETDCEHPAEDVTVDDTETNDSTLLRIECPNGDEDCPDGFYCENSEAKGMFMCHPLPECSLDGISSLEKLHAALGQDINEPVFIKLSATVMMDTPTCTLEPCTTDDPCCKECFAALTIGQGDFRIPLVGTKEMPVLCEGNNCNVQDQCEPLVPGTEYIIWGSASLWGDGPQLRLDGFCSLSDLDTP